MTERWTAAQYADYLKTGKVPGSEQKRDREEVRVSGGRHHRIVVKRPDLGISFDSMTEERRYDFLMEQPEVQWVDVHPIIQLPHGIRYQSDFLVHFVPDFGGADWIKPRLEDVKSNRGDSTEFRRLKKILDSSHPFAPLYVVKWVSKQWNVTH